jgi:hypothetical protein
VPPENHKDIELVCLLYPGKPWCNPRDFCNVYPKAERCENNKEKEIIIISDEDQKSEWYLTGILVDKKNKGTTRIACAFDGNNNYASTSYYYYAPTLFQSSLEFL